MAKKKYTCGKDGYFQTKVWDGSYKDGKKHFISLRSKKSSGDLEKKVTLHNQRLKERTLVVKTDTTFLEYARAWKNLYKTSKSPNTIAMYDRIIEKHLSILEGIKLQEISRAHYQSVINNAIGHTRTQQQIQLTFRQIIKSAIADQLLAQNIYGDIFNNIDSIRYRPEEKRPLLSHEKEALFMADFQEQDKIFIYILYGCGLRRGEALALTTSTVNLQQHTLTIKQSLAFDKNNAYIKAPKSKNSYRTVPIPNKIFDSVKTYIEKLGQDKLFTTRTGGWMTKSAYTKMWKRILACMQEVSTEPIIGLSAHIFRHNYCTNLCYQIPAISIKKIAELLGDTDKMVIEVYNHILLEKEDALVVVEKALDF